MSNGLFSELLSFCIFEKGAWLARGISPTLIPRFLFKAASSSCTSSACLGFRCHSGLCRAFKDGSWSREAFRAREMCLDTWKHSLSPWDKLPRVGTPFKMPAFYQTKCRLQGKKVYSFHPPWPSLGFSPEPASTTWRWWRMTWCRIKQRALGIYKIGSCSSCSCFIPILSRVDTTGPT